MTFTSTSFVGFDALLALWQGHRRLTRRTTDAFPDDKLFTFPWAGAAVRRVALEIISISVPMLRGLTGGGWMDTRDRSARPNADVLRM